MDLLLRLARRELPVATKLKELELPYWEHALLHKNLLTKGGSLEAGLGPRKQAQIARNLAEELDVLRRNAARRRTILPSRQYHFKGKVRHLDLLMRSLAAPLDYSEWNHWRRRFPKAVPDLRGAILRDVDLDKLEFRRARLAEANLSGSSLVGRDLSGADLRNAILWGTDLRGACLRKAKLNGAWFQDALLSEVDLREADLRGARILGCILNRANLCGANMSGALFWGTSVWEVERDKDTDQTGVGIGLGLFEPMGDVLFKSRSLPPDTARVNDIVVADFLSHINYNRSNIASILNAASQNIVLILGRFSGEQRQVLTALESALSSMQYVPIVFDFEEPLQRDLVETVAILAGLSHFVVADLSFPHSTPLESHLIIPDIAVPFVPIIRKGQTPFSMFFTLQRKYPWVLPLVKYAGKGSLERQLRQSVVSRAERLAEKLRKMKHPR